jgi:hypothetical protein
VSLRRKPRRRSLFRSIGFGCFATFLGIVIPLLIAEGVCRTLPVTSGARATPVNADNPVFHFTPDREYVWSFGWRFSPINRGRINNAGFINDQDYDPADRRPLLAVVGDSYIEALMVPFRQTLHARMQDCIGERGRVYSFAASGAPLSQYLIWADDARRRYAAQAMVFAIVGNDFDESLSKYKVGPGFHHFQESDNSTLVLQRYDYSPTILRKIFRRSALARYLVLNLHLEAALAAIWNRVLLPAEAAALPRSVGNTAALVTDARIKDSERVILAFFDELPRRTALAPNRVAFLMDGIRPQLYQGQSALHAVRDTYYPLMREFFMREARARGYGVVDLQPLFMRRHQADGTVFEFEEDAHWNGAGHEMAAQALLRLEGVQSLFSLDSQVDSRTSLNCPTGN